jgi:5-methylcytosine-specific restriction endonuclease McrBC regulatory subunit McrC
MSIGMTTVARHEEKQKNYCDEVRTLSTEATLDAAAKIPVHNVWYLLLYAWDMAKWRSRFALSESEPSPRLLGLLAHILAKATHELLRHLLRRAHVARRETILGILGRIDFATSLKRVTLRRAAMHCDFSELGWCRGTPLVAQSRAIAQSLLPS